MGDETTSTFYFLAVWTTVSVCINTLMWPGYEFGVFSFSSEEILYFIFFHLLLYVPPTVLVFFVAAAMWHAGRNQPRVWKSVILRGCATVMLFGWNLADFVIGRGFMHFWAP